tara:strand:- start:390 stop:497 length:108 start_codon:yes stop_codon:yes gene_type:complete
MKDNRNNKETDLILSLLANAFVFVLVVLPLASALF